MTTTPTPTGKIRGSLQDVLPKLRNFTGAVKVTTSGGKGGLLLEMGRLVASYLTQEGVLHRGKASLDLLGKEPLAEFEILRYDDEQFREARIICENRGLLLGEEKGAAPAAPSRVREETPRAEKQREEATLLSSMMKRFAVPKPREKEEPARAAPAEGPAKAPMPAVPPSVPPAEQPAAGLPVPRPEAKVEKVPPAPERKEAPGAPQETDLSAIIKRLRESPRAEKGPSPAESKAGEGMPKAGATGAGETARPAEPAPAASEKPRAPREEKAGMAASPGGMAAGAPGMEGVNGRVKVDLGQMMKRIKRLDITSIRKELEEGAEGMQQAPAGDAPVTPAPALPAGESAVAGAAGPPTPAQPPGGEGKSDIDELKAFIRKLEVLEEPKEEPPSEAGLLGRLGMKSPAGERAPPAPKRETPPPVPRKEKPVAEPAVPEGPRAVVGEPPVVSPVETEAPKPPEPDRKAKIASILRRSGLVKPPIEEQPKEIIVPPPVEPKVVVVKEVAAAPAEGAGVPVPKLQRKKVEITRVPKIPEKSQREPPLIDEKMIQKILKQPGVIAVSTFFEGFAVQSAGRADFEQVAANAEDLFRAGKKIAQEIDIGPLNQIILETGKGKLIIAPHGDLNVCIFTEPDANLGLIRVAIRGMLVEKD
jgi:predicted regulator of Ras-like GTPase activity (Roadblock/LC7/MglB family)